MYKINIFHDIQRILFFTKKIDLCYLHFMKLKLDFTSKNTSILVFLKLNLLDKNRFHKFRNEIFKKKLKFFIYHKKYVSYKYRI